MVDRRKRRKRVRKILDNIEPDWDSSNEEIQLQLCQMLNWYNYNKTIKDAEKYFVEYLKKNEHDKDFVSKVKTLPKGSITPTMGWAARIAFKIDGDIPNSVNSHIDKSIEKLKLIIHERGQIKSEDNTVKKKKPNVQENIKNKTIEFIGELEHELDKFILSDCKSFINVEKWMMAYKVKSIQAKDISEHFEKHKSEIDELLEGKDEQLNEAYSFLNKRAQRRLQKFIISLIDGSKDWESKAKRIRAANRKPRKSKPKSPVKLVSKLNYLKETDEYGGLKSVPPTRIIGASQLWVFNVKYRTLGVYYCPNDHGFSVKGSTLQNFDLDKSIVKKLRKPEDFLDKVMSLGKVALKKLLSQARTKSKPLTGRINKDTIILRVL